MAILINGRGAKASANIQQAKAKASKTAKFIRDTYVGGSGSVMYFGGQRRRQRFSRPVFATVDAADGQDKRAEQGCGKK